jgi:hypothetical protein
MLQKAQKARELADRKTSCVTAWALFNQRAGRYAVAKRPFTSKAPTGCCLRRRFDCYRVERTSSRAGVAPAEVQRLSRAHFFANYAAERNCYYARQIRILQTSVQNDADTSLPELPFSPGKELWLMSRLPMLTTDTRYGTAGSLGVSESFLPTRDWIGRNRFVRTPGTCRREKQ